MHPILSQAHATEVHSLCDTLTLYPLDELSVFEARGTEARAFLQGQITNDIANAGPEQARLAGYCTAQGRLLATMVIVWTPDSGTAAVPNTLPEDTGVLLGLLRRDLMASVLKRLSMFVLRAKAKLNPTAFEVVGVSLATSQLKALSQQLGHDLPTAAWQALTAPTGLWLCAPSAASDAMTRWWWLAADSQRAACETLKLGYTLKTPEHWQALDIAAGLPWVEAATQDLLIPQTLNLDLIEGVSFTKGCYPGQEIVARSHYRGTVKRRMHFGQVTQTQGLMIQAGSDIFDALGSEQACGRVINSTLVAGASAADSSVAHLLFETTFEALARNALHVGGRDGALIRLGELPYATKPA
ncbi:MAG: folate-binding protein YgfZ [Alcaligenaceae bacterium]|nr:MAG: folate-binding protein YgfZ [Alcaligenaceae bacterium]